MYVHPAPILPPRRPKSNWMPWLFAGGAVAAGFVMLLIVIGGIGFYYLSQDRVAAGVSVAGVNIGGESADDALKLLKKAAVQQSWSITVRDSDRTWPVPMSQLGVGFDFAATMKAVESAKENTSIPAYYAVDLMQTQQGLISLIEQVNIDPTLESTGRAVEIPVVLDRLRQDANGELADGILDLTMIELDKLEPEPQLVEVSPAETYTGPRTTHVVQPGQELALIAREYSVTVNDIVALNQISDPNLIFVGQELLVPAAGVYTPSATEAPPAPLAQGKAIIVSTQEQRIYAYENGELIHSHLASTGRAETPTVLGDYKIYVKFVADDMQGPDYFLPQVPYTMYFYQGYGIHGTYWHNSFGRPMSHGCVNLPTNEAEWFFNWAEVGTMVRVI